MASQISQSRGQPHPQQPADPSRAKWTSSLTKILADLLVDHVNKSNRVNNSFAKKSWRLICDNFFRKTGLRWDKDQLKNRYAVLRRQHAVVKFLLGRSDFILDESTGAIVAADEAWDEYVKDHPDAEAIRTGGCPIYKQLCEIFADPATNGNHEQSNELDMEHPSPFHPTDAVWNETRAESSSEYDQVDDVADNCNPIQHTRPTTVGNRKRGRKGFEDSIADAMLEMAAASRLEAAVLKQLKGRFSLAECIRELAQIRGVEEHVYFAAFNFFNNPNARETFLSLKQEKRLAWLQQKCSGPRSDPS